MQQRGNTGQPGNPGLSDDIDRAWWSPLSLTGPIAKRTDGRFDSKLAGNIRTSYLS